MTFPIFWWLVSNHQSILIVNSKYWWCAMHKHERVSFAVCSYMFCIGNGCMQLSWFVCIHHAHLGKCMFTCVFFLRWIAVPTIHRVWVKFETCVSRLYDSFVCWMEESHYICNQQLKMFCSSSELYILGSFLPGSPDDSSALYSSREYSI